MSGNRFKIYQKCCALILLMLFLSGSMLYAQSEKFKFGKVEDADLAMTVYPLDSTATAVVLGDFGQIYLEAVPTLQHRYRRHRRLKILDQSAFDEANIEIPYYSFDNQERITMLKAQIIQPDGERLQVPKKEIYDEAINQFWSKRVFTFPQVQVGSILEYRYEITSERIINLREWKFQGTYPVVFSELEVFIPKFVEYVYLFNGTRDNVLKDRENSNLLLEGEDIAEPVESDFKMEVDENRYTMRNVPAINEEPYITTLNNYRAGIQFQLSKVLYRRGEEKAYLTSWEDMAKDLRKAEYFGDQYQKDKYHEQLLKATAAIRNSKNSKREKAYALYDFLSREVEWNGYFGKFVDSSLDRAFANKSADSGELNLMLLALLRSIGVEAWPMLISTRSNGYAIKQYPILDQFNHVLVLAKLGGKDVLMDVGDPMRRPGYPRISSLNTYGWVIKDEEAQWMTINAPKSSEVFYANIQLDENGSITGSLEGKYSGYDEVSARYLHRDHPNAGHWKDRLAAEGYGEVEIDSLTLENEADLDKALYEQLYFRMNEVAQTGNDLMYLRPVIYSNFNEAIFKKESRLFPIDIPYPFKEQFVVNLKIPDGYTVEELPETARVTLNSNGGEFNFLISQPDPQTIQVVSKIQIRQLVYQEEEYSSVKKFFDEIAEKLNEQIVLKKTAG